MSMFLEFLENLKKFGLEFYRKYYGSYVGIVTNIEDPEQRGRVKVIVPSVAGKNEIAAWADPFDIRMAGKKYGEFLIPNKGDFVTVMFEFGDIAKPVYGGGYYIKEALADDFKKSYGNVRGWVFKGGAKFLIDETKDKDIVTIQSKEGSTFILNGEKGKESVLFKHKDGASLLMNEKGDVVLNDKENKQIVTLKSGEISIVSGGKISLECKADASITAKGNVNINSSGSTNISASGSLNAKGSSETTVGGSSATNINGSIVKIAGGSTPVAKLGSKAMGQCCGAPMISTIIDGSGKVLVR